MCHITSHFVHAGEWTTCTAPQHQNPWQLTSPRRISHAYVLLIYQRLLYKGTSIFLREQGVLLNTKEHKDRPCGLLGFHCPLYFCSWVFNWFSAMEDAMKQEHKYGQGGILRKSMWLTVPFPGRWWLEHFWSCALASISVKSKQKCRRVTNRVIGLVNMSEKRYYDILGHCIDY